MKNIFNLFILLCMVFTTNAAVIQTTGGGGNWDSTSTWLGGVIPGAADIVVMNTGDTLIVSATRSCQTLAIAYGNTASLLEITSTGNLSVTSTNSNDIVLGTFPVFAPYNFKILVDGTFTIDNLSFTASTSGVLFDLTVNGTMTVTNTFQIVHSGTGDNCPSTITIGNNGSLTCADFRYRSSANTGNTLVFNNNGDLNLTSSFSSIISEDCDVLVNINDKATFTKLDSRTSDDNSAFSMNVVDSLLISSFIQLIASTTALETDNKVDMDNAGAYLRMGFFTTGTNGTLNSTSGNASTVEQISSGGGITVRVTENIRYHHLIVDVSGTFGVRYRGDTLDQNHLFGDLTIKSGTIFRLEEITSLISKPLGVTGNLIVNGTLVDHGSGITVGGDITNTSLFNNDGSVVTVGGDFTNSGTFDNISNSNKIDITGNFTNSGTFLADLDSLVVGGNFTNSTTYTSSGNNIYLSGNWGNTGTYTFTDGDSIVLQGSSAQSITGTTTIDEMILNNSSGATVTSGTTSIKTLLDITSGNLNANGGLTFLSDATGTAALADLTGGGTISGNVTVQRFLNEGNGWYMLASPVTGSTLADWNTELPMSGFTGSDEPTNPWVSVYQYDETTRAPSNARDSGYVEATNTTQPLTPGEGWFLYFQDVKVGNTAGTYDVVGPLQTGAVALTSLSYTASGGAGDNGWHLLGNPYASPVDWSAVSKTNVVSNEAYVMGADGSYKGVNADNIDNLYSGEAFWIEIDLVPPFPFVGSVTFAENDKVNVADDYNAKKAASPYELPLKMELTSSSNATYMDYAVLQFNDDPSYTENFDFKEGEARKLGNALGFHPTISMVSADSTDIYYNTMSSSTNNVTIPIRIWKRFPTNTSESFTVTFNGIDDWVMNNKCLILWDSVTNVTQKIDPVDNSYTFTAIDSLTAPRLFLTYSAPLEVTHENASCFGFSDGSATVEGDGSGKHTYTWTDENGTIVHKDKLITGKSTVNNLPVGNYTVWVTGNGDCGTIATLVSIEEPDPIIAEFTSDKDTVFLNANTTIFFTNASLNAVDYFWDFGDGNTSSAESPSHTYQDGGVFDVMMVASEEACSDTLYKTIIVINNVGINDISNDNEAIKIYQQHNETFVEFNLINAKDATITMQDVVGRSVIEPMKVMNVTSKKVKLQIPQNLSGIYTIGVYTGDERMSKKLYYTKQ